MLASPLSLSTTLPPHRRRASERGFRSLTVTGMMPDVATEQVVPARRIEQRVAQDLALSLREQPGVTAVELAFTGQEAQERVATARFEVPTDGWTTADIHAGVTVSDGFMIRAGVRNLADRFYVNHLNSFDPFTRMRIAEVGRSTHVGAEYGFQEPVKPRVAPRPARRRSGKARRGSMSVHATADRTQSAEHPSPRWMHHRSNAAGVCRRLPEEPRRRTARLSPCLSRSAGYGTSRRITPSCLFRRKS